MISDGYFDMSAYIQAKINKDDMYATLSAMKSRFAILYNTPIPKRSNAMKVWVERISMNAENVEEILELQHIECVAIVNWVYRTIRNKEEREIFTIEIFSRIKDFYEIQNDIQFREGVVYNAKRVEIQFISSVAQLTKRIKGIAPADGSLFYRGHADANYRMRPSIMRSSKLEKNESRIYHELQIACPDDFEKCRTHLEVLVKMQHYGLPTRLLDITRNPLVALYFACEDRLDAYGEVILISAKDQDIKYPKSDTISVLASLAALPFERREWFQSCAKDPQLTTHQFNQKIPQLLHEIQLEKPAFRAEIKKVDVLNSRIVQALKNNNRIVKQDGAFIVCSLDAQRDTLEGFRYQENGKRVVLLVKDKQKILEELEIYSINRATLFPEIESVAAYLKKKYT